MCSLSEGGGSGQIMYRSSSKNIQKFTKFDFWPYKNFFRFAGVCDLRGIHFLDNIIHYMKEALPISRICILSISRAMRLSCNRTSGYILFDLVVRTVPITTFTFCHLFICYTYFCLLSNFGGIEGVTNYLQDKKPSLVLTSKP